MINNPAWRKEENRHFLNRFIFQMRPIRAPTWWGPGIDSWQPTEYFAPRNLTFACCPWMFSAKTGGPWERNFGEEEDKPNKFESIPST